MRALAAHRRHLCRRAADEDRAEAIQIGLALVPVVRVLLAQHVRALDVLHQGEGSGAHDVLLVPVHVLRQDVGAVDEVVGRQQRGDERAGGILELEAHRVGIGRLDGLDHRVLPLARRAYACRRENDLVVGGLDVLRGHGATVVELDAPPQLEVVGPAVGGDGPAFGERRIRLGAAGIVGIDPQQRVVERRQRMDQAEGLLPVPVVRGRLGRNGEHQIAAVARRLRLQRESEQCAGRDGQNTHESFHDAPPPRCDRGPCNGEPSEY